MNDVEMASAEEEKCFHKKWSAKAVANEQRQVELLETATGI